MDLTKFNIKNTKIISLTPYSTFLLTEQNHTYDTFHSIISVTDFRDSVLKRYASIEKILESYKEYTFIFRDIAKIITYETYISNLYTYICHMKKENYRITYITDSYAHDAKSSHFDYLHQNTLSKNQNIDKSVYIDHKDRWFYLVNRISNTLSTLLHKQNLSKQIYYKLRSKFAPTVTPASYDNLNFISTFQKVPAVNVQYTPQTQEVHQLLASLKEILIDNNTDALHKKQYLHLLEYYEKSILEQTAASTIKVHPFTFLSPMQDFLDTLIYRQNNIPTFFMQHGSYLHENIFLKYNEIFPADINFVFNDYTKELFEKRGAKKVYSVGSINFNYPIKEKKKKYDFLYITDCSHYSYTGIALCNKLDTSAIDANDRYLRHKSIIELFGNQLQDQSICIKIQPGISTARALYIPFIELSKKFTNVTIEFSLPIPKLISMSRYIISDYFSSEFINRNLHYKREIILFKGFPMPFEEEVIPDMNKMFILVDTVKDLKKEVKTLKAVSKIREKNDHIIEYYSSKECDTREIVRNILKNELKKI